MYKFLNHSFRLVLISLSIAIGPVNAEPPETARQIDRPAPRNEPPMIMNTGHHAKITCGNTTDLASKLVCISWINGASAGNGWTQSRAPTFFPDYCPPSLDFDLGKQKALFVDYLEKASDGKLGEPAILLFREAMAKAYPCEAK